MDYQYDQAVEILGRTPATLTALLRGLPDALDAEYRGARYLARLRHRRPPAARRSDRLIERARVILEHGEEQPFDTFNRTAMFEQSQGRSLDQLLAAFAQARADNLATLRELDITPEKLTLTGAHPALGTVTLSQLLATWVVHDLNHIGQIVEVMSRQYAEAVGPWNAYLAILTRPILTE